MRPVHYSASLVPLVVPAECHLTSNSRRRNSRCYIDIVGDQNCLVFPDAHNEPLVPTTVVVVRQNLCNDPATLDVYTRAPIANRVLELGATLNCRTGPSDGAAVGCSGFVTKPPENSGGKRYKKEFFH